MKERILITGGSGFIGSALVNDFLACGHKVTVYTRQPAAVKARWPEVMVASSMAELTGTFDVLVNLAGEGIADKRWSAARKKALYDSRVTLTLELVQWAMRSGQYFRVVLSGSAVGYYGGFAGIDSDPLDEDAAAGDDFAARLCRDWEAAAAGFASRCQRLVILRTGIVLDRSGGMLKKLLLPFSLGLGGVIGDGEQVLSWISLQDYRRAITFLLSSSVSGPVNMVSPQPVCNRTFTGALAAEMHRPARFPMPAFIARLLFGEMSCLLLQGQTVLPARLLSQKFPFDFTDIRDAVRR